MDGRPSVPGGTEGVNSQTAAPVARERASLVEGGGTVSTMRAVSAMQARARNTERGLCSCVVHGVFAHLGCGMPVRGGGCVHLVASLYRVRGGTGTVAPTRLM